MCPRGHSWDHPRGHSHLCKPANRGPAQPGGSQPVSVWWSLPFSFSHALFSKHMKLKPWARLVGFSFKHVTQPLPRNLLLVFSQPHLPLVSEHPREGILALPQAQGNRLSCRDQEGRRLQSMGSLRVGHD